jgi:hypothetical protein
LVRCCGRAPERDEESVHHVSLLGDVIVMFAAVNALEGAIGLAEPGVDALGFNRGWRICHF